ncbi:MAG TPA: hypothetical protein ENN09_00180 [Planctomycetes bacterium]|nr:hypothetical protein [Planctomycetota bacterium]
MKRTETRQLRSGWKLCWAEYACNTDEYASEKLDDSGWLDAAVPGDVHLDLMRLRLIDDPFVGTNADNALWMEQKDWWYRLKFQPPEEFHNGSLRLVFHGLDCFASVYLNGVEIARHENMFTPCDVDVTHALRRGSDNVLAVKLASPLFAPLENPSRQATWWGHPRQLARKAQMSYGWDIAPRLVTIGIWRPVELIHIPAARVSDAWMRTRSLNAEGKPSADVSAGIAVEVVSGAPVTVTFEAAGRGIGRRQFTTPGLHEATFDWKMDDVMLWWPNGYGQPNLYPYRVTLTDAADEILDERSGHFGVRTVALDASPNGAGGHNFKFVINGREIFACGWNWTPPDAIFARSTPQRRAELLELARASGANMLRVWGGGVYEAQDFYDAADRLGLLVWQDFMFACSQYPQDERFLSEVRREAEYVVKSLRSHPSLALWCGDNECDMCYPDAAQAAMNRINRAALPQIVSSLSPDVPYIPTSPYSPAGRKYNDPTDSEMHLWKHGASHADAYFMDAKPAFISEIGFLSLPGLKTVKMMFGDAAPPWPPEGRVWDFHASDCIRIRFFRGMKHLLKDVEACGRALPDSLEQAVETTQELQAEACREWVEAHSKRPECGGILLWNLCDCWPQMSDAVIGWPLDVKKAYQAASEAFRNAVKSRL